MVWKDRRHAVYSGPKWVVLHNVNSMNSRLKFNVYETKLVPITKIIDIFAVFRYTCMFGTRYVKLKAWFIIGIKLVIFYTITIIISFIIVLLRYLFKINCNHKNTFLKNYLYTWLYFGKTLPFADSNCLRTMYLSVHSVHTYVCLKK